MFSLLYENECNLIETAKFNVNFLLGAATGERLTILNWARIRALKFCQT